jgi:hypothetical protein
VAGFPLHAGQIFPVVSRFSVQRLDRRGRLVADDERGEGGEAPVAAELRSDEPAVDRLDSRALFDGRPPRFSMTSRNPSTSPNRIFKRLPGRPRHCREFAHDIEQSRRRVWNERRPAAGDPNQALAYTARAASKGAFPRTPPAVRILRGPEG